MRLAGQCQEMSPLTWLRAGIRPAINVARGREYGIRHG